MAIPLSMPNSDDNDDGHRLDLLLEQLLITLRQVLVHRRRVAAAAAAATAVSRTCSTASHVRHRYETVDQTTRTNLEYRTSEEETRVVPPVQEENEMTTTGTTTTSSSVVQFPLPDVVLDTSSSGKDNSRIMRSCRIDHGIQCCPHCQHNFHLNAGSPTSWFDEGGEFIRYVGELINHVRSTTKEP